MVLIFLTLFTLAAFGEDTLSAFYGQKDFQHYYGPVDPEFTWKKGLGSLVFASDERLGRYALEHTEMELSDLSAFFDELETANLCPDSQLVEHAEHIRYLYRLSALSYLEEHLARMEEVSEKLKLKNVCGHNLQELLEKCRPISSDMKLFVKSAGVLSRNFEKPSISYDFDFKKYSSNWLDSFKQGGRSGSVKARMSLYCEKHDCSKLGSEQMAKAFRSICDRDKLDFVKICSEKDKLYGLSKAGQALHAIASSDAIGFINEDGNGIGCLARYSKLYQDRELRSRRVETVVAGVYEKLARAKEISGRLFPAGSLRRFVEKGLGQVFVESNKAQPKTSKSVEKPLVLAPLAPEPLKKIFAPKPREKKSVKVVKEAPKPVAKSHFLQSAQTRKEFSLNSVKLNMVRFQYDYVFNSKMLSFLESEMEKFTKREGLEEMKEFDSLGTKKGPVPLLFIKYLIDQNMHQSLTTLIDVLGETFYVKNNIDDAKLANPSDLVRLSFEAGQSPPWQLYILED